MEIVVKIKILKIAIMDIINQHVKILILIGDLINFNLAGQKDCKSVIYKGV